MSLRAIEAALQLKLFERVGASIDVVTFPHHLQSKDNRKQSIVSMMGAGSKMNDCN